MYINKPKTTADTAVHDDRLLYGKPGRKYSMAGLDLTPSDLPLGEKVLES